MLAIIEDGFSMVSEISTSNQVSNSLDTKINGGFSTKALLDKLLRIQLDITGTKWTLLLFFMLY